MLQRGAPVSRQTSTRIDRTATDPTSLAACLSERGGRPGPFGSGAAGYPESSDFSSVRSLPASPTGPAGIPPVAPAQAVK